MVLLLLFLDCTVVVDKDECPVELGILLAICACIAWTQIALSRVNPELEEQMVDKAYKHTSGSYSGRVVLDGDSCNPLSNVSPYNACFFSCTHCHGRLLRCGETSTQLPRSRLKRLWEMSFRIGSDMVDKNAPMHALNQASTGYSSCRRQPERANIKTPLQ